MGVEASPVARSLNDPGNSVPLAVTLHPIRSLAAHLIVRSGTDTETGVRGSTPNHPHHPRTVGCVAVNSLAERSGRGAAWLARLTGGQEVGGSNPPGPTRAIIHRGDRPVVPGVARWRRVEGPGSVASYGLGFMPRMRSAMSFMTEVANRGVIPTRRSNLVRSMGTSRQAVLATAVALGGSKDHVSLSVRLRFRLPEQHRELHLSDPLVRWMVSLRDGAGGAASARLGFEDCLLVLP